MGTLSHLRKLHVQDGEMRYILHAVGYYVGQEASSAVGQSMTNLLCPCSAVETLERQ